MITTSLLAFAVHALLNHNPVPIIGDYETMQVKVKTVLHSSTVNFGNKPARFCERTAIKAHTIANGDQLARRLACVAAATTANVENELSLQRTEATFERSDAARRDPCRS